MTTLNQSRGPLTSRELVDPKTGDYSTRRSSPSSKHRTHFTGEDVVEISCHGSPVLLRQVIDHAWLMNARIADAGEFSLRALANGRMDLAEAEAIRDLIDAQTRHPHGRPSASCGVSFRTSFSRSRTIC